MDEMRCDMSDLYMDVGRFCEITGNETWGIVDIY